MSQSLQRRLVIVGVSHSHLYLLKYLKKNPISDLEIYIISDCFYTPYSGTLPGYTATHFNFEESHIDLIPLMRWLGCQFIYGSVQKINTQKKIVILENELEIFYDTLCVSVGSVPALDIPFSKDNTIFIKPIPIFIKKITAITQTIGSQQFCKIAIVGGGVSGVETAFSLHYRFRKELQKKVRALESFSISIFTKQKTILSELTGKQRNKLLQELEKRNIQFFTDKKVEKIEENNLVCNEIENFSIDYAIICTSPRARNWIQKTPLKKDKRGFLLVNSYLQAIENEYIFASGDTASIEKKEFPKAGVYSVRQGPILSKNIINHILKKPLKSYKPQTNFLKIISTGNKNAVFCWKKLALKGNFFWWLKKKIDLKFLEQYKISHKENKNLPQNYPNGFEELSSYFFTKYLQTKDKNSNIPIENSENTQIIYKTSSQQILQTTYFLKKSIPDFYLFGKTTANHCANNFFANQVSITSMTPLFFLQSMQKKIIQDNFEKILLGIQDFCKEHNISVIGGKIFECSEQINKLGINLQGKQKKQDHKVLQTSHLIMTKPLGTGVLQQALQTNQITGKYYQVLLEHLLISNQKALQLLPEQPIFCAAIENRGLLPSLLQKLPIDYQIKLNISKIPLLDGFIKLTKKLEKSILQKDNESIFPEVNKHQNILFSPQTCGALVIAVPVNKSKNILQQLKQTQYKKASIIGTLTKTKSTKIPFVLDENDF